MKYSFATENNYIHLQNIKTLAIVKLNRGEGHLLYKQKLINNDPIYLEDLQWVNPNKVGWSDDRWRP